MYSKITVNSRALHAYEYSKVDACPTWGPGKKKKKTVAYACVITDHALQLKVLFENVPVPTISTVHIFWKLEKSL